MWERGEERKRRGQRGGGGGGGGCGCGVVLCCVWWWGCVVLWCAGVCLYAAQQISIKGAYAVRTLSVRPFLQTWTKKNWQSSCVMAWQGVAARDANQAWRIGHPQLASRVHADVVDRMEEDIQTHPRQSWADLAVKYECSRYTIRRTFSDRGFLVKYTQKTTQQHTDTHTHTTTHQQHNKHTDTTKHNFTMQFSFSMMTFAL